MELRQMKGREYYEQKEKEKGRETEKAEATCDELEATLN